MNWGTTAVGLAIIALVGCRHAGPEFSGRLVLLNDGELLVVRRDSTETIVAMFSDVSHHHRHR